MNETTNGRPMQSHVTTCKCIIYSFASALNMDCSQDTKQHLHIASVRIWQCKTSTAMHGYAPCNSHFAASSVCTCGASQNRHRSGSAQVILQ